MSEEVVLEHGKKRNWLLWLIVAFVLVLGFLVYTSFFNPGLGQSITGNVIKEKTVVNGVPVYASLDSPEVFRTEGNVRKIDLKVMGGFSINNNNYDLDKASVIIDGFSGKVAFNDEKIIVDGEASKVFVEGTPITGKLNVKINNEYNYLKLDDFYLDSFSEEMSGVVKFREDKVSVTLDNEVFSLNTFMGDLEKSGGRFEIEGLVEEASAGLISVRKEA